MPRRSFFRYALALLLVGAVCMTWAAPAAAQDAAGSVVQQYKGAASGWIGTIQSAAERLFIKLAGVEIVLMGLTLMWRDKSLSGFIGEVQLKLLLLAFLFGILSTWTLWFPAIAGGFMETGQSAIGSTVSPGAVVGTGVDLMWLVLSKWEFTFFSAMGNNLVALLCAVGLFVAFLIIAAQLVVALVEVAIVTVGGLLLMGFAAFRGTAALADGYITYLFYIGIKIFLLYLLIGLGDALANDWQGMIGSATLSDMEPLLQATAGAFVFGVLVFVVPEKVASRVTQSMNIGIAEGLARTS